MHPVTWKHQAAIQKKKCKTNPPIDMKTRLFPIFTLLALMVSSCGHDEMLGNRYQSMLQDKTEFVASFEDTNESRTYIEEDTQNSNLYLRWTKGDEISIFRGTTLNQRFQFSGETGDNSGSFKLVPNDDFVSSNELDEFRNYAFYPYDENTKITEKGVFAVTLPATQNYAENSFGLEANSMVAVTETIGDVDLKFKNVGGYFKFKFYGDNLTIKSVTLKGNNGEKLTGKAHIASGYGMNPEITMSEEATDVLTLQCGNGIKVGATKEEATEFWFVLPPTKFTKGFTITVTDIDGGVFTKTTEKEFEIKRNTIKPISAMEVETAFLEIEKKEYELLKEYQFIEVRVKSNIKFDVVISTDWIGRSSSSDYGNGSYRYSFRINGNNTSKERTGKITFKNDQYGISEEVLVNQLPLNEPKGNEGGSINNMKEHVWE